jgi:hypothetical protein
VEDLPNNEAGEANKASDKTGNQDIKHFILISGFSYQIKIPPKAHETRHFVNIGSENQFADELPTKL